MARRHQTSSDDCDSSRVWNSTRGDTWTHLRRRWRSDGSNDSVLIIVAHDRRAIVAKLPCDSGHDHF